MLAFDPLHGADNARQYAGKYCSKPEKWYWTELKTSGRAATSMAPWFVRSVRPGYYLEAEKKEGANTTGANTLKDFIKARTAIRAVMPRMRGCGGAAPSRHCGVYGFRAPPLRWDFAWLTTESSAFAWCEARGLCTLSRPSSCRHATRGLGARAHTRSTSTHPLSTAYTA